MTELSNKGGMTKSQHEAFTTVVWIEPFSVLGIEKCVHKGCEVAARERPFYSAYCHSRRHKKRLIRFEMARSVTRAEEGDDA